jgi:hypothetical protein
MSQLINALVWYTECLCQVSLGEPHRPQEFL